MTERTVQDLLGERRYLTQEMRRSDASSAKLIQFQIDSIDRELERRRSKQGA